MLNRLIPYFGGKGQIAKLYPPPRCNTIVEPFAGGANYALRYHHRKVILIDKDVRLYKLWKWLIEADPKEIMALPTEITDLREMDLREEAKYLIGWWLGNMSENPRHVPTSWMTERWLVDKGHLTNFWGAVIRNKIAKRVLPAIRHWRAHQGDFSLASNLVQEEATWFIDPPYHNSGTHYKESSKNIDFDALGDWCRSLPGQVIVCEQEGADWLPFQPLCNFSRKGRPGPKTGREVVWLSDGNYRKQMKGFGL